jgi:FixJ family two-component response regulator
LKGKFNIPIIFITGNSDVATLNRAQKVNPVAILFKPIDENQLRDKIVSFRDEHAENL